MRTSELYTFEGPKPRRKHYISEACGLDIWSEYANICDAIDNGVRQLLIRSCNGVGKTALLGALVAYELEHYEEVSVVCSGATATQLTNGLWKEIKKSCRRAKLHGEPTKGRLEITPARFAMVVNPAKAESGQGYHAKRVVVLIDEATSLGSHKIAALMSNATGADSLTIFTYNPIDADAHVVSMEAKSKPLSSFSKEDNSETWYSLGLSAFQHPNVIFGVETIKGAVTRDFVERILNIESVECAYSHPNAIQLPWSHKAYLPTPTATARVLGELSLLQTTGFIHPAAVVSSWAVTPIKGLRSAGVDVGAGEDPTVITWFDGNEQKEFFSIKTGDFSITCEYLANVIRANGITVVCIDDTGVGHGVTSRLLEYKDLHCTIIPVHFGARPKGFDQLRQPTNARSEMYLCLEWELRRGDIKLAYDKELQRELTIQKLETAKRSATVQLEDKRLIIKRLGRSPDKADATAVARYGVRLLEYQNRKLFI